MDAELYKKLLNAIVDPAAVVLFVWLMFTVKEDHRKNVVIMKLLKAQEERGVVLTKIVTMVEAMFVDSRRAK
jgi:hypothetical protein